MPSRDNPSVAEEAAGEAVAAVVAEVYLGEAVDKVSPAVRWVLPFARKGNAFWCALRCGVFALGVRIRKEWLHCLCDAMATLAACSCPLLII
jgi:hypothetical protein